MWYTLLKILAPFLGEALIEVLRALWEHVRQRIPDRYPKDVISRVLEVAEVNVFLLAEVDWTNKKKRNEAYRRVQEDLRSEGLEVAESIVNWAIESAVQALKRRQQDNA